MVDEDPDQKDTLRALGLGIAVIGGLLTITVVGAVIGIPLMVIGVLLMLFAGRIAGDGETEVENTEAE